MKKWPLLTVVMPVYNGERYLNQAIESVLSQTYTHFEFLIIDDGSSDESGSIIEAFAGKDKRVRLISLKHNGGISAAMNRAIKSAKGDFIVRADADDICQPDRFAKQLNYLLRHPKIGVLGSFFCLFQTNSADCRVVEQQTSWIKDGRPPVNHPTCFIRTKLFARYGYYDSRFDNAEDTELWFRFYKQGVVFDNLPECLYKKRVHPDSVSVSRIRSQVALMLRINLRAVFFYRLRFSLRGYLHMLEQALYLPYLFGRELLARR